MNRSIIHLDLDAFFVAVERRKNPSLNGIPLIIGGSTNRGVVAACSYEARKFGIHSAMPMYQAMRLCPDATVIRGDISAYSEASRAVTQIITEEAPCFEKASIDEFYIDATGMDRYFGTFKWAKALRARIIRETALPISLALATNKLVAKVATGEFKPNAEIEISPGREQAFFDPLEVDKIPMIGKRTATMLHNLGIHTVAALRNTPLEHLRKTFGRSAEVLRRKAHAEDNSAVVPYREQKSISTECTFDSDTVDVPRLRAMLVSMVEKVAFTLRDQEKLASCIAVKLRYNNFDTITRQCVVPYTSADHIIQRTVLELFEHSYNRNRQLRLIGVRLAGLVHGNYQINLFDDTEAAINLYQSIDHIKHRYGADKIFRANTIGVKRRLTVTPGVVNAIT